MAIRAYPRYKKIRLFLYFCVATALFANIPVRASLPIDVFPYEIVFEDTNMIFYMTPPQLPPQDQLDWFNYPDISEERMKIKTGMYYNEEPLRNIYYVDINAHRSSMFFSQCGTYLVTIQSTLDNFNNEDLGGGLVNFFSNGSLIKSYKTSKLVRIPMLLPWTSAGIFWLSDECCTEQKTIFNPITNELTITTYEEYVFVFDVATGKIIEKGFIIGLNLSTVFSAVICICVAIIAIRTIRKRRKKGACTLA